MIWKHTLQSEYSCLFHVVINVNNINSSKISTYTKCHLYYSIKYDYQKKNNVINNHLALISNIYYKYHLKGVLIG